MNSQTDKPLRILSAGDLHNINEDVTNRVSMVRDHQVLQATVKRPYLILFGEEQFPTLIDKASATLYSLAAHHVFIDGNKRTAIRATQLFLEANGLKPTWTDDIIHDYVLKIAQGHIELEAVIDWLPHYVEKIEEIPNDE
ncbi:MAG: type II toxin-antitoxin system death-on-curing family toxin [Phototrophicaceae bacterium]